MPTLETYYVNTASAGGGDGTTNDTSGPNAAFASQAEFIANSDAVFKDFVTRDVQVTLKCCGVAADTVMPHYIDWICDETRFLQVEGNADEPDGRNFGATWSNSHYRLDPGSGNQIIRSTGVSHIRFVGLQMTYGNVGGQSGFQFDGDAVGLCVISCRIMTNMTPTAFAINQAVTTGEFDRVENNIITGFSGGVRSFGNFPSNQWRLYNNVIARCANDAIALRDSVRQQPRVKNNTLYDNGSDYQTNANAAPIFENNAGETGSNLSGTTGFQTMTAPLTDHMVAPLTADNMDTDPTPIQTGVLYENAVPNSTDPNTPIVDINEVTRKASPDIGAIEIPGIGPGPNAPQGVNADGVNDRLQREGALTGLINGRQATLSFWFKEGGGTNNTLFSADNFKYFMREPVSAGKIQLQGRNAANTPILTITSLNNYDDGNWHHCCLSFDLITGTAHLYIDDVDDLDTGNLLLTNEDIDWAQNDHFFFSNSDIGQLYQGCIADFYHKFNTYTDLSQASERIKLVGPGASYSRDLGADGTATGMPAPEIYFAGETANWHINKGTGGGYTEFGELTDCANNPPDYDMPPLVSGLYIGANLVQAVKLGSTDVQKIYLGDVEIWP